LRRGGVRTGRPPRAFARLPAHRGEPLARGPAPDGAAGHRGGAPAGRHRSRAARVRDLQPFDRPAARHPLPAPPPRRRPRPACLGTAGEDLPGLTTHSEPALSSSGPISHGCANQGESTMLALLSFLALYGGWRASRALLDLLRRLPRSNDDMVFY